jgi:uncharacterized protein YndB with AHSA1/START domain
MTQPSIAHGSFSIERVYDASPTRVFAAWSDIEIKAKWFIGPEGWTIVKRETEYVARFHEIVANERIVYVYDMYLNGTHHSLSLSTVEIAPAGGGARLVHTEQIAYLDGTSGVEGTASREHGVGWHLDNLANVLRPAS